MKYLETHASTVGVAMVASMSPSTGSMVCTPIALPGEAALFTLPHTLN